MPDVGDADKGSSHVRFSIPLAKIPRLTTTIRVGSSWMNYWIFFLFLIFPVVVPRLNSGAGKDDEDGVEAEVEAGRQVKHDRPGFNGLLE